MIAMMILIFFVHSSCTIQKCAKTDLLFYTIFSSPCFFPTVHLAARAIGFIPAPAFRGRIGD